MSSFQKFISTNIGIFPIDDHCLGKTKRTSVYGYSSHVYKITKLSEFQQTHKKNSLDSLDNTIPLSKSISDVRNIKQDLIFAFQIGPPI